MPLNIKPEYKILVVKNIICANVNTLVFFLLTKVTLLHFFLK